MHGLEFVAVGNAAADDLDDLAELDAHGHFDQAGVGDFAGEREDLGALAALRAHAANHLPPLRMMGAMLAKVSTLLISVGLPHRPLDCGIGRPRPGRAALAFDGGDQRGLFAADEGAGAEANLNVEAERRVADVVAEQAAAPRLAQAVVSRATASGYSART